MARYIDADELINELSAACMPIYEKGITGILGDNSSIADIINEQPAADVQEVKHGEWREHNFVLCARRIDRVLSVELADRSTNSVTTAKADTVRIAEEE